MRNKISIKSIFMLLFLVFLFTNSFINVANAVEEKDLIGFHKSEYIINEIEYFGKSERVFMNAPILTEGQDGVVAFKMEDGGVKGLFVPGLLPQGIMVNITKESLSGTYSGRATLYDQEAKCYGRVIKNANTIEFAITVEVSSRGFGEDPITSTTKEDGYFYSVTYYNSEELLNSGIYPEDEMQEDLLVEEEIIPIESIEIKPGVVYVNVGEEKELQVIVKPKEAADQIENKIQSLLINEFSIYNNTVYKPKYADFFNNGKLLQGKQVGSLNVKAHSSDEKKESNMLRVFVGDNATIGGIYEVKNSVEIGRESQIIKLESGKFAGPLLKNGDVIVTKENSGAKIIFADGLKIMIRSNTTFNVSSKSELSDSEMILKSIDSNIGEYKSTLNGYWSKLKEFIAGDSFKVKIPNGACGVRG